MAPLLSTILLVALATAAAPAVADAAHGFNNSCISWSLQPSADAPREINLVARCANAHYAASQSDADIRCSSLDLNA
ncbi:hypothetical protein F5B20DRAFT_539203 [Whalleya microplaca]|nr:hypothetical protein F5B20DRAFT_539203 [Whalleya microplaca]